MRALVAADLLGDPLRVGAVDVTLGLTDLDADHQAGRAGRAWHSATTSDPTSGRSRARPTDAKGYVEGLGHATIVVDGASRTLAEDFIAGHGVAEAIHLEGLAVKTRTPIELLVDTITTFPTTAPVLGGLFAGAARELVAT